MELIQWWWSTWIKLRLDINLISDKLNGTTQNTIVNGIPPIELNRSISRVIDERKYNNSLDKTGYNNNSRNLMSPLVENTESYSSPIDTPMPTQLQEIRMYPDLSSSQQIKQEIDQETEQPIDMSWPKTLKKQLIYLFLAPIMWPLYLTLPDVKKNVSFSIRF